MRSRHWMLPLVSVLSFGGCTQTQETSALNRATEAVGGQNATTFACPYVEYRSVAFSSKAARDILTIAISGRVCDAATVTLTVTSEAGNVVHLSHARALDYTNNLAGAKGVETMLEGFIAPAQRFGSELPELADAILQPTLSQVNESAYKSARRHDLPVFCHQAGAAFSNCFVYFENQSQLLYVEAK